LGLRPKRTISCWTRGRREEGSSGNEPNNIVGNGDACTCRRAMRLATE
jgi:hypothetical protein